jgi:hypothetical protein
MAKHWWKVYNGDDEYKFFTGLVRCQDVWKSVNEMQYITALPITTIWDIVKKYTDAGILIWHSPKNVFFGYWENVSIQYLPVKRGTITQEEQKRIIEKELRKRYGK